MIGYLISGLISVGIYFVGSVDILYVVAGTSLFVLSFMFHMTKSGKEWNDSTNNWYPG